MSIFPEAQHDRMPVALVTGFLGSGKTTLINRLLAHEGMANTAVVVNEFGEIALDQAFIAAREDGVMVLANGCVCCTAQGDLGVVIGTLHGKEGRRFDRMVIETTGLADPAPVIETLVSQPFLTENFALDSVIATVDALFGAQNLAEHAEAVRQAALADRIVITKTDLADADALATELRALNPGASILRAPNHAIAPADLFGAARDPAAWVGRAAAHEAHLHGIESFALTHDAPLPWRDFSRFLTRIKVRHGPDLLRVKGIVAIASEDRMLAIHGVHHLFHPPERLPASIAGPSRLIFIAEGPSRAAIEAEWRDATAKDKIAR
jgi:G3E family GTPase